MALPPLASRDRDHRRPRTNPGTAPAPIEIVTQEQHLWTTFAEGDFNTIRNLFTPDFIQVDSSIQASTLR